MFVTATPTALPGTCIMCPRSVRAAFIDTEIQIEWHGAVLLCDQCVVSMGRLFGMVTENEVEGLVNEAQHLHDQIFNMQRQLAALEGIRDGLAAGGFVVPDGSDMLAVPFPARSGDEGGSQSATGDLGTQGGAAPEQVHDEGLAELRPTPVPAGILDLFPSNRR